MNVVCLLKLIHILVYMVTLLGEIHNRFSSCLGHQSVRQFIHQVLSFSIACAYLVPYILMASFYCLIWLSQCPLLCFNQQRSPSINALALFFKHNNSISIRFPFQLSFQKIYSGIQISANTHT